MHSEFEFIRNLKDRYGLKHVGDDCAVLPKDASTDLIVTADLLVEDVDFRLEWTTPQALGHRALAVSLSDIAAMGGTPTWAILSIGLTTPVWESKFADEFYAGWFGLAGKYSVELVGGDISKASDKIVIDSIVGGEVPRGKAILRSGARPGDSIFVTGALGGAAAGLTLLESGTQRSSSRGKKKGLIARQLEPMPRVEAGKYLLGQSVATAMIDISDGLAADLYHLCDASNVGAVISLHDLPLDENLDSYPKLEARAYALGGGEDFELLFTSHRKKISSAKLGQATRIGEVTSNAGIVELVDRAGVKILPRLGYRHF